MDSLDINKDKGNYAEWFLFFSFLHYLFRLLWKIQMLPEKDTIKHSLHFPYLYLYSLLIIYTSGKGLYIFVRYCFNEKCVRLAFCD